jgi:GT2 family glycosyltransferase
MAITKASIVVLCYNGLSETTRPCLESIVKNTPTSDYELIVVDNASSDGTVEYLKNFAARYPNTKLHLNSLNKGYAGGNNDGIKLATGRYIILLNNDTLVPKGWLDRLLRLFDAHPALGLVGPITNSAGNEQRVDLDGLTESNYEEISGSYIARQNGIWFTTERLGFFCVAMRRNIPEKIGLLDEQFSLGMFEDDDYCVRTKNAGFEIAVAEDCFVYHKGSMSFKNLSVDSYRSLFENNKLYYCKKHGVEWTFSSIAIAYWEKANKDLITYASRITEIAPEVERILVRHHSYRSLLVQLQFVELANKPNNIKLATINKISRSTIRKLRWEKFKKFFLNGNLSEKIQYITYVVKKLLNKNYD